MRNYNACFMVIYGKPSQNYPVPFSYLEHCTEPGHVAQSIGHLTRNSESWVRYPVWPHAFVFPTADSRGVVVSYWRKYVHEVLAYRLGGLSLFRKSVVRFTDRPDMTLDVYRGRKTLTQQALYYRSNFVYCRVNALSILD